MAPKNISASQINTYRSCGRKYYLQYIVGIKSPVTSPQLVFGSKIHDLIARGIFESDDVVEQNMLDRAKNFLETLPPNPIFETKYSDGNKNPGRFYGEVLGHGAIGVFDFHWADKPIAGDWKTGAMHKTYVTQYDVQGYILGELYKQRYGKPLDKFYFKFLKDDQTYNPACLSDEKEKKKTEKTIKAVLFNIEEGIYGKKCGPLCSFCDMSCVCCVENI